MVHIRYLYGGIVLGVVALLWRDKRVVTLLSTNAQPQESDTVQRREGDGTRRSVTCPAAMALYN